MIVEKELNNIKGVEELQSSLLIDEIKEELAEYQAKCEQEMTVLDILLDSRNFFNELDRVLKIIELDLRKTKGVK